LAKIFFAPRHSDCGDASRAPHPAHVAATRVSSQRKRSVDHAAYPDNGRRRQKCKRRKRPVGQPRDSRTGCDQTGTQGRAQARCFSTDMRPNHAFQCHPVFAPEKARGSARVRLAMSNRRATSDPAGACCAALSRGARDQSFLPQVSRHQSHHVVMSMLPPPRRAPSSGV